MLLSSGRLRLTIVASCGILPGFVDFGGPAVGICVFGVHLSVNLTFFHMLLLGSYPCLPMGALAGEGIHGLKGRLGTLTEDLELARN